MISDLQGGAALWAVGAPSIAISVFQKACASILLLPAAPSRIGSSGSWDLVRKGCRDLMGIKVIYNSVLEQLLFLAFRGLAWNLT